MLLPVAAFVLILLLIAAIGGGWLALGRVDPLLAVPGAGWAAAVSIWASRNRPIAKMLVVAAGAGAIALGAIMMLEAEDGLRGGEWLLAIIGLFAATQLAGAVAHLGAQAAGENRVRLRLVSFVGLPLLALAWSALFWPVVTSAYAIGAPHAPPNVVLLTALPLASGGDDISAQLNGDTQDGAALAFLRRTTRLTTIVSIDAAVLAEADAILLAHPATLQPQELVALDTWVRSGGRAVILADGLSSWADAHDPGDPRAPPVTSLLGPLLTHWGVELDAPELLAEQAAIASDSGRRLGFFSPGRFRLSRTGCRLAMDGVVAECRVGGGSALLVADADLLMEGLWAGPQGAAYAVDWRTDNMLWLLDKLSPRRPLAPLVAMARPSWSRHLMPAVVASSSPKNYPVAAEAPP